MSKEGIRTIMTRRGVPYTIRLNRDRIFYPNEWERFFSKLKERQKFTFNFLINTGARINEARHVQVKDIDFKKKLLTIKTTKKRGYQSTGKIRIIPLSDRFLLKLKETIEEKKLNLEDYLSILSTPAANIAMKKALVIAGIKDYYMFSVHNVRKTLETWLCALNLSELKILSHFGHDRSTALRYYIQADSLSPEDKLRIRKIIDNLYYSNGDIDRIYDELNILRSKIISLENK
jgi:integrase